MTGSSSRLERGCGRSHISGSVANRGHGGLLQRFAGKWRGSGELFSMCLANKSVN